MCFLFRVIVLFLLKVLHVRCSFIGNRDGWTSQVHGNIVKESDSQRLVGVPALDASFENPLARYQNLPYNNALLTQTNPSNTGLMSVEGHLRSPLQNQVNWQVLYPNLSIIYISID